MKYILLLFSIALMNSINSQSGQITIKAQKQMIVTSLDEDNTGKVLFLNSHKKTSYTDKLIIHNGNASKEKDWKRSFIVFDDADAEQLKIPKAKGALYQVSIKNLVSKLNEGKGYSLYTVALPTDAKRAAVVRVRRVFLCKISMK